MTTLHSDEYRRLVDALRAARQNAGVTQEALAERLGVEQPDVSKYEKARRRLDVIEFLRILAALELSPEQFLTDFQPTSSKDQKNAARQPDAVVGTKKKK